MATKNTKNAKNSVSAEILGAYGRGGERRDRTNPFVFFVAKLIGGFSRG
jgi:hypothetical protein